MPINKIYTFYQKELLWLRAQYSIFTRKFPKIGRRLGGSEGETEDPHVERLIESFALLNAHVSRQLEDDEPVFIKTILNTTAPQFLRCYPSTCIVKFDMPADSGILTKKTVIPAATLMETKTADGISCKYTTTYPVNLEPITIKNTQLIADENNNWSLHFHIQVWSGAFFSSDKLRLYLNGHGFIAEQLYSIILGDIKNYTLSHNGKVTDLNKDDIKPVGFADDECVFDFDSSVGYEYNLLHDFFNFKEKFNFIDIALPKEFSVSSEEIFIIKINFERGFLSRQIEQIQEHVNQSNFHINCSPAINLFKARAEPIIPSPHIAEYPVVIDTKNRNKTKVWMIDNVSLTSKSEGEGRQVLPNLFLNHTPGGQSATGLYWQMVYDQKSTSEMPEIMVAISQSGSRVLDQEKDTIHIDVIGTNGNVPSELLTGDPAGDFFAQLPLAGITIRAIKRPSRTIPAVAEQKGYLNLFSHLTSYKYMHDGSQRLKRLKDELFLWCGKDNNNGINKISLIKEMTVSSITARINSSDPRSLARGLLIKIVFSYEMSKEFDYYIFCIMLNYFIGLYSPLNSFSKLVTKIEGIDESEKAWPIRSGKLEWL